MITIGREELKRDWKFLIDLIQKEHVMGPEITNTLYIETPPQVNKCTVRCYFIRLTVPERTWYVCYAMAHIIKDVDLGIIGRAVDDVVIYDNYQEYECDRVKQMSKVAPSAQTGLNLN